MSNLNYVYGAYLPEYNGRVVTKTMDVRTIAQIRISVPVVTDIDDFEMSDSVFYHANADITKNVICTPYLADNKVKICSATDKGISAWLPDTVLKIERVKATLPEEIYTRYATKSDVYIPDNEYINRAVGGLDKYIFECADKATKKFTTLEIESTSEAEAHAEAKRIAKAKRLMLFDGIDKIPSTIPKTFYRMRLDTFFTLAFRFGCVEDIAIEDGDCNG